MKTKINLASIIMCLMTLVDARAQDGASATINMHTGYFEADKATTIFGDKAWCSIHAAFYAPSQVLILKQSHSATGFYCPKVGQSILLFCANGRCENKEQKITLYSLTPDRFLVAINQPQNIDQVEFNFVATELPPADKFLSINWYGWKWNVIQNSCRVDNKSYDCATLNEDDIIKFGFCDKATRNARQKSEELCKNAGFTVCSEISTKIIPRLSETKDNVNFSTGCEAEAILKGIR